MYIKNYMKLYELYEILYVYETYIIIVWQIPYKICLRYMELFAVIQFLCYF